MPNFVKVDSKPFHPDTYVGPEHEEDFLGGTHERDMGIKLRVENTVRWRWAKNRNDQDVCHRVSSSYYEDLNLLLS
jgi:RNA polymerase-associated protein LEO1